MLLRGPDALRETAFPPMEPGLAALNARVKRSFDPGGVLNPGRMYEGF
jgi:glycolate oxidase FAD binding subunit